MATPERDEAFVAMAVYLGATVTEAETWLRKEPAVESRAARAERVARGLLHIETAMWRLFV